MKIEAFEAEITRLENQLQDAISALRALPDIQTTFQDLQARYERLQSLIDEAARLPERYAQEFATVRQQAEARLAQLEAPIRQQQTHLETLLADHQQQAYARLGELAAQLQQEQAAAQTTVTRHQQIHQELQQNLAALQASVTQMITAQQHTIAALDQRTATANEQLRVTLEKALQDQNRQLREGTTAQFNKVLIIGLLAGTIALGAWIVLLTR